MSGINYELARNIAALLNDLFACDPAAAAALVELRTKCNATLANHPLIQVWAPDGNPENASVGILGVLNGLAGTFPDGPRQGSGVIAAQYADKEATKLTGFGLLKNE